jgi:hypothetical protein
MTWIAVGVGSAAVVGGLISSNASSKASKAQQESADKSIASQERQQALTRQDNAPFLKTGTEANRSLAILLGQKRKSAVATSGPVARENFDSAAYLAANPDLASKAGDAHFVADPYSHYLEFGSKEGRQGYQLGDYEQAPEDSPLLRKFAASDMEADPVYQSGLKFGLDRGTDGINSRATASGMYDSGATLKALTTFGNDYGSTKANESYNRFTNDQSNIYNKLAGISGTGQVATNQIAASGSNAANNISQSIEGAGNARAAGIVGGANAWGNAGQGVAGAANNYQSNKALQALLAQNQNYSGGRYTPQYSGYSADGSYAYG